MTLQVHSVTFDATNAVALANFWSAALDRPVADGAVELFAQLAPAEGSPGMMFFQVPEGKSAKNRMHLDLFAPDREAEVTRLVALGATRGEDHDEFGVRWTVLADVEGNEFCVASQSTQGAVSEPS
jgi:hypothetical protein